MAHSNNENELTLQINSNVYRLDLNRMLQINHVTGKERQILRRSNIQSKIFDQILYILICFYTGSYTIVFKEQRLPLNKTNDKSYSTKIQ